jgi:hypothetical protein
LSPSKRIISPRLPHADAAVMSSLSILSRP